MAVKKSELYSSLWASCDALRGGMDASQYKDYKHLSHGDIKKLQIPMPPTADGQNVIANLLTDIDAEIEKLEKELNKYRGIKSGIMSELFTGRIRLS